MPSSDRFRIGAYIYALVVVTGLIAVILTLHISRQVQDLHPLRGALVAAAVMAVAVLSSSATQIVLLRGLSRLYTPLDTSQRWTIMLESSALGGLAGGLASGGLLYAFTKSWLPITLPSEELFILLPVSAMVVAVASAQIRFWLREADVGRGEANKQLDARARQLEQEAEVREKFLLTMAHESRTPLTSLRVSSELLRDVGTKSDDPVITRLSLNIGRSSAELASLYANIVDIGRIMKQDFALKPETMSLSEVLNAASGAVNPAIAVKRQKLKLTNGPEVVEVVADRQGINRILVSILDNASRYSPSDSEIEVVISADGRHVVFEVKDQGAGIPPEEQEKIFQPFYRIKSADSQHGAGIGIGLTVAKALVEAHGGNIWVNSSPGQGSSFFVKLPAGGSPNTPDK